MVEIVFPLEVVVAGLPASLQSSPRSRSAWKRRVREASDAVLPDGHFATDKAMAVTLYVFTASAMQGDIDNIVKPILDAFSRHVYLDDRQVERIWVQRFSGDLPFHLSGLSTSLDGAAGGARPSLYIRLSADPLEDLR